MKNILFKRYKTLNSKENQISDLELHFKKVIEIIFQYHKNNKTIIFLDSPYKFKTKQHLFLSTFFWPPGLLTNKQFIHKDKSLYHRFSSLNKKPHLFVVFDHKLNDSLFKETLKLKIPVLMFFNSSFKAHKIKYNKFIYYLLRNTLNLNDYTKKETNI